MVPLPDVVDRRLEIGQMRSDGFVRFRQICHFRTNRVYLRFNDPDRLADLILGMTGQPEVEDALVPRLLRRVW